MFDYQRVFDSNYGHGIKAIVKGDSLPLGGASLLVDDLQSILYIYIYI